MTTMSSEQFTIEQADAISRIVRENLHPHFAGADDELNRIEIRQMADGSGNWGVFILVTDLATDEHAFRHIVTASGEVQGGDEI